MKQLLFCNYHKHDMDTNVRISDSTATTENYAQRAKELGHTVLSTCNHGWQGNVFEDYKIAKKYRLKLLVSAEAYWVIDREEKDRTNCHIFIGALNERGRRALNDVLSEANITGFYGQPRLDIPLILSLPKDDVVVTTACIAYWRYGNIEEITKQFADHFGKNFFLEVQYHNTPSQIELNKRIVELHDKYNIPLIMGCDSHYIYPDNATARVDFLASKGLVYEDEEGWFLDYPDGDTAYQRFANQCVLSHEQIIEAIENTLVFERVEEYDSPVFTSDLKLPSLYPELTQEQKDNEYKRLVWQGWDEYKKDIDPSKWPVYESEIKREMQAVIDSKMSDYFIIDYHVMKKGKENGGTLTRSGRGSGASFFTNTLLGFSDVDRISATVHMYPERFLSATRILQSGSCPDIDMNEGNTEPFVRAQAEILGQDHSYPMIAYGTMKKSAAWKLYAKSQGVPFEVANEVSERIKRYELAVKHADEDEKDNIKVEDFIGSSYLEIYNRSKDYLGLVTSWSIAPCSSLIYQGSIREEIGLVKVKDNLCCAMDGHAAEDGHFLKNDHLKVSVVDLIFKSYRRIGMKPPKVKDLLAMCPPDDACWDIYKNGCTIGINQCEQTGTAARVMKYAPKNISELTAFVAAIRPGFKSMYRMFETREPFAFGVKAFDSLIQTKEMPDSFVLYQEQVMAALHYAGIPMDECYTAIKNIAKKRAEKVLAYKDRFKSGFKNSIINDEGKSEEEAEELASQLWQCVEDNADYSFNASHAYCVALDSLYGAWLKAHHPLAFYETYIKLMEEKGDKDKINAAKDEAESHFGIRFAPLRYGQDNRTIHADEEHNEMINTMGSIKGYGVTVGKVLYQCSKHDHKTFIDVLAYLDKNSIKEAKFKPLILIDYFEQFGNQRELLRIAELWDFFKQGTAKSIKKDSVKDNVLRNIIQKYTTSTRKDGTEAASFTFHSEDDVMRCLYECEETVRKSNMQDLDMRIKIQNSLDILGYCDVRTGKEEDRRRLLVTDVFTLKNNGGIWAYRLATKSLGSGKTARVTVKSDLYNFRPINQGDIIYATDLYKNKAGYWYLSEYTKEV